MCVCGVPFDQYQSPHWPTAWPALTSKCQSKSVSDDSVMLLNNLTSLLRDRDRSGERLSGETAVRPKPKHVSSCHTDLHRRPSGETDTAGRETAAKAF